jgi:hypothetical protein
MPASTPAQTRWVVDPSTSLAWWQVAPHLEHLWATTCPADPAWRPGEGRSGGWSANRFIAPKSGYQLDTSVVPLYPRYWVLPVCLKAVHGRVVVADTARWRGMQGEVTVQVAALMTGDDARDEYARDAVLDAGRYPEIRFVIDSLVEVKRQADTVRGVAMGVLFLRDVSKPGKALVQAWPHGNGYRVLARLRFPASTLVPDYGLSRAALGLGVGLLVWQYLFAGVDLVLQPEPETPGG